MTEGWKDGKTEGRNPWRSTRSRMPAICRRTVPAGLSVLPSFGPSVPLMRPRPLPDPPHAEQQQQGKGRHEGQTHREEDLLERYHGRLLTQGGLEQRVGSLLGFGQRAAQAREAADGLLQPT